MAKNSSSDEQLPDLQGDEQSYLKRRPLAARMRPQKLSELVGHKDLLGEKALLPRLIQSDQIGSLIFYGPPGCGKTSLAEVIALETKSKVVRVNAVLSGTPELREILNEARKNQVTSTLVIIDELHRFNKTQQDLLLPDVEAGVIRLIGCTTHNPGLYVIPALLSRSHLFRLEPLSVEDISAYLEQALLDIQKGLGSLNIKVSKDILNKIAEMSSGDCRRALNILETLVLAAPVMGSVTEESLAQFAKERRIRYDDGGDDHYDTASAFIKSIRGGDPDAALYWLVLMLEGGEEPRFIARRLVILASEDIGLADSRALGVAVSAFQSCEMIGQPECEYALAHATLFLTLSPKSNSATKAIAAAKEAVRTKPRQEVPIYLKDSHTRSAQRLGQGTDYLYSHDFPEAISGQDYLTSPLKLYQPTLTGAEVTIAERLNQWRTLKESVSKKNKKHG